MRKYKIRSSSIQLTKRNIKKYGLVILNVLHDDIDVDLILNESKQIIDTSGSLRRYKKYNKKLLQFNDGHIGCGYWGKNIVNTLHENSLLSGIYDFDPITQKKFCKVSIAKL